MATEVISIGAVGAGRMGRGIAIAFVASGHPVTLIDLKPRGRAALAALEAAARSEIETDLNFLAGLGVIDATAVTAALARVSFAGRDAAPDALAGVGLLMEGVPETLEAKAACFAFLSEHVSDDCIVASTSSTISPDQMAPMMSRPERFINAHWLNPAYLIPLVEVSPAAGTSAETVETVREILRAIGKVPVMCKGPGYIVPRIQALAMNEAARMVDEGVGTAEEIDTAIRVGFGLRFSVLGMLEFIDWGGGDTLHYASGFLGQNIDAHRFAPAAIIERNMEQNRRGVRDGEGFYDYRPMDVGTYRAERLADFVSMLRHRNLMPKFVTGGGE
jgi:3-hydroxybutyryl-CoA dehydrogenase